MDRILEAPANHHPPSSDLAADADVDADEASRKRARTEARRKFRIVTTTILATNRLVRCVIDVEAEQPEQAESEIIAAFGALEVKSSEEMVVHSRSARNQGLTYSSAGGKLKSELNFTSSGSFPSPNEGYCPTGLGVLDDLTFQDGTALSDDLFDDPRSIHECSKEGEEWPYPSLEVSQDSMYYAAGFVREGDNEMQPPPETDLSDLFDLSDFLMSDYPLPPDSQEEKEKATSSTEGRMLINEDDDVRDSGRHEQERQESSEESLQNLLRIDENSEDWKAFVTRVIEMIIKTFQDLEKGSGRAKVDKLAEDARDITKKIETPGTTSEGNRLRNMEAKATTNTLPTIRDAEQYSSDIYDKLQAHVNDLSRNVHGRQSQLDHLQSMSRLIQRGRKALQTQGRHRTSVSGKLNRLVKDLDNRKITLEMHLNKCAASVTTLIQLVLENEKKNFTSVASVRKWYCDESSSRQSLSDFYPLFPVVRP